MSIDGPRKTFMENKIKYAQLQSEANKLELQKARLQEQINKAMKLNTPEVQEKLKQYEEQLQGVETDLVQKKEEIANNTRLQVGEEQLEKIDNGENPPTMGLN